MTKKLNEHFELLEELIKKIDEVMSNPINYEYQLKWLMSQDNRKKLFETNPKCFLMMKQMEEMFHSFQFVIVWVLLIQL